MVPMESKKKQFKWVPNHSIINIQTRIANAIFHLSAFARFPALHCLSMIQGTTYLVMDSMIELNDYYIINIIEPCCTYGKQN